MFFFLEDLEEGIFALMMYYDFETKNKSSTTCQSTAKSERYKGLRTCCYYIWHYAKKSLDKFCFTCNTIYISLKLGLVFKAVFIIFMFFLRLVNTYIFKYQIYSFSHLYNYLEKAWKTSSVMCYLKSRFTCFFRCSSIFRIADGSKLF